MKRARPDMDRLLQSLYGGLTEREWADDFLAQLCCATRSRSAALVATDVKAGRDTLPAWVGAEAATAAAYETRFSVKNPWRSPSGPRAQSAGTVLLSDDACALPELKRTDFWLDFLKPMDMAHGAGVIGLRSLTEVASLTLLRSEKVGVYSGHELMLLRGVAPHWANACKVRGALGLLSDAQRGLSQVLDRLALGVFILDAAGCLLRTNVAGEAFLEDGALLAFVRGRLNATHNGAAFTQALDEAMAAPAPGARPSRATPLYDRTGRLQAHAATHALVGVGGIRAMVFVQRIAATASPGQALHRALKDAFGLTDREAALACRLDAGDDVGSAAARVGVSLEGARTRVKAIFSKTGTCGQSDLARFLAALRAVLGQSIAPDNY